MKIPDDGHESRKLQNLEFYKIAVRKLSKNSLFFPTQNIQDFELKCNGEDNIIEDKKKSTVCGFESISSQVYYLLSFTHS